MDHASDTQAERAVRDKFLQRLLELGLLTEITPPMKPEDYPKNRRLLQVEGTPLSELIIAERR